MRILTGVILSCVLMPVLHAGLQQDFFAAKVRQATRVRIIMIGPEKTVEGASRHHVLLDSTKKERIEEVASTIDMIDPRPEKESKEDEVWKGSVLSFGVAAYIIEFFEQDHKILEYGTDCSLNFLAPYAAHAAQGTDLMLDYPLTSKSEKRLKHLIAKLK